MATLSPHTADRLLKRPKKKAGTRGRRRTVLQDTETIEAVCLAELGKSNHVIRGKYDIDLKDGQLTYRLKKAKEAAGFDKGDGFRKAWREGRSGYEEIVKAVMPQLRKDYEEKILPQVEVPVVKGAGEQ